MKTLVATALGLLLATPAAALAAPAPDPCERRAPGPRYEVRTLLERSVVLLVACDHRTGRRRVLARGRWESTNAGVFQRIDGVARSGDRVAWLTVAPAGGGARGLLTTLDLRGGRRRQVEIGRSPLRRPPRLEAVYTPRAELAYSTWDAEEPDGTGTALVFGGRVIARGRISALRVDDPYTLRWRDERFWGRQFADVRPPPLRAGCPVRPGIAERRWYGDVLVTTKHYPGALTVVRVCRRGSGHDRVLASIGDMESFGNGLGLTVLDGGSGLVTYELRQYSRYDGCLRATRRTVEATTLRVVEEWVQDC